MITLAPMPTWKALIFSIFTRPKSSTDLAKPWKRSDDERAGWLSRSAWSLVLLAHWRSQYKGGGSVSVWLPDYFCAESLTLLRHLNVSLYFYPITEKLIPDFPHLREKARIEPPDILMMVHYFGMPSPLVDARELCKVVGSWLVEDAAHVLTPAAHIGTEGDFVIYSPHKLIALPDGALLVARPNGASKMGREYVDRLGLTHRWSEQATRLLPNASQSRGLIKWTLKRCLQKLGMGPKLNQVAFDDMPGRAPVFPPASMSGFAKALLHHQSHNIEQITQARKRNRILIDQVMANNHFGIKAEPVLQNKNENPAPYHAGYLVPNARSFYAKLRRMGYPATTWPDLAPEVGQHPDKHSVAIRLRESSLFLPVHQSVGHRAYIGLLIKARPQEVELNEWNGDRNGWQSILQEIGFSNLLQSWIYGDCKVKASNWQVRRYQILYRGRVVGLVQTLQRRYANFLNLTRINRGPIFFKDVNSEIRESGLIAIGKQFGDWRRGNILSWAPECRFESEGLLNILRTNFRQFAIRGWSSSVIDLQMNETQLRTQFSSGWRNILNVANRRDLKVHQLDHDSQVFEHLLSNCAKQLKSRGVRFPEELYRCLKNELVSNSTPGLLLAIRQDSEIVAATYVVIHGDTATYLLGWSGDIGRKISAHYLLLWENLIRLKKLNIHYFDLGGIDEEKTPGIAAFKLGIGGERYQLVGEGWCW
jgi:hypothetical protein